MNCPICNKLLADGSTFCDGCGANVSAAAASTVLCPKCGLPTPGDVPFCQNCGAPVSASKKNGGFVEKIKQIPKKFLAIGAAVVAVILVVAIVLPIVLGAASTPKNKSIAYVKDGEMFFLSKANGKPVQVTTKLFDDFEHEDIADSTSDLRNYVITTPDGSRMFYVDKVDADDEGVTLFYKNPKKEKQEGTKIDSNIESYYVNEKGNRVIYEKDGKLYEYNLKEKTKIADDVVNYGVSIDTKTVIYETEEDGIFIKKAGKDKIEVTDDETADLSFVTEDYKVIYFTNEDNDLYRYTDGEKKPVKIASEIVDKSYDENGDLYYVNEDNELMFRGVKSDKDTKIDTDVKSVGIIYEGGKFYYTKAETTEEGISQYIDDDMKASDDAMTEPVYPNSDDFYPEYPDKDDFDYPEAPKRASYESYDEYRAAYNAYSDEWDRVNALYKAAVNEYYEKRDEAEELYNKAVEEYREKREEWSAKVRRDELRADIEEYEFSLSVSTYFYYNGKKSVEICKSVGSYVDSAEDAIVRAYKVYGDADVKVKLSEISSVYSVESEVKEKLNETATVKIFVEENVLSFDVEEYTDFRISDDGKTLYYVTEYDDENNCGELYSAKISAKKLEKAEKISDDVYKYFVIDGNIHYFYDVDTEDYVGEYHVNGKKVAEDVYCEYDLQYNEKLGTTYFYTDYDEEEYVKTVNVWDNGKVKQVGEEIRRFTVAGNGDIYFLKDVSDKNYKGDLYVYTGGKEAKKVDEDVYGIVRFYTTAELIELRSED